MVVGIIVRVDGSGSHRHLFFRCRANTDLEAFEWRVATDVEEPRWGTGKGSAAIVGFNRSLQKNLLRAATCDANTGHYPICVYISEVLACHIAHDVQQTGGLTATHHGKLRSTSVHLACTE